jgi:hypothetical protein
LTAASQKNPPETTKFFARQMEFYNDSKD